MDCKETTELLPWLLNGSLEAAEEDEMRNHLAQCELCQQELAETKFAWNVFQQHAPTEDLIDYAFDRPPTTLTADLIKQHLKTCRECAEQFEMARESRRLMEEEGVEHNPEEKDETSWWKGFRWPTFALAASLLITAASLGGWLWNWRQTRVLQARILEQQRELPEKISSLETENRRLRDSETELHRQRQQADQQLAQFRDQVKELTSPQANVVTLDVYPTDFAAQQKGPSDNQEVVIPAGARTVTLILISQSATTYPSYNIQIADAKNNVLWNADGITRNSSNDYTINLPGNFLSPGHYTLNIFGKSGNRRQRVESYRIRVNQPRR